MQKDQIRQDDKVEPGKWLRNRVFLFYVAAYLVFAGGALRIVFTFINIKSPFLFYIIGLLIAYFLLLTTERLISPRLPAYQPVYFALQLLVVLALTLVEPHFDYYAILFVVLYIQAVWFMSQKAALVWILLFSVCMITSELILFGFPDGVTFSLTYIAAGFLTSLMGINTLRSEQARAESQMLLVELQAAHQKLKEYAEQVEELSAAQERNRLARDLHDSVTQTIFSMSLTAQSALILMDRDPARVKEQLTHLQSLSKNALAEMRSLIQQLRPHTIAEEGLAAALHRHANERRDKDGLAVEVKVFSNDDPQQHLPRLPVTVEEGLFRVIQEALNNVVKHAQTDQASVMLDLRSSPAQVIIEDRGAGFDLKKMRHAPGHFGLASMEERVRSMGAQLVIESQPGTGTRIFIKNIPKEIVDHA